jgi:hypothetical protein
VSVLASSTLSDLFDRLAAPFAQKPGHGDELLNIAGIRIRLSFASEALREQLTPALLTEAVWSAAALQSFTILIWEEAAPEFPWRHEDLGPRGAIDAATTDTIRTAFAVGSSALSMLDLDRGLGLFRVRDARELPWYERAAPLRTLLHWMLESKGVRFVHAAALATGHGGALLAGRGGSGKSTTAMLCVEHGFHYAGDDYVAVSADARAHAIYTSAKLRIPGDEEKSVVLVGEQFPQQIARTFPLRALIVPRVAGGTSRLSRISRGEALRALAPTTLLQLPGSGASAFAELAELARKLPAWSLELGDDRAEIPRLVARAIEESR